MIGIREVTFEDLPELTAMVLREADQKEIRAALGRDPNVALCEAIKDDRALNIEVATHEGHIVAVYGLHSSPFAHYVMPWLVATEEIHQFKMGLLRWSRSKVKEWLAYGVTLINYVDSRNTDSMEWLEWLGFTIHRDYPVFLHDKQVPFYAFTQRRSNVSPDFDCADHSCGGGDENHGDLREHGSTEQDGPADGRECPRCCPC